MLSLRCDVMLQVGRTPLYIATQRGQTEIVELLVDKFHANVSSRSNDGSTLMHVAALCGNAETALAMLKKGVPLNMPNKVSHKFITTAPVLHSHVPSLLVTSSNSSIGNRRQAADWRRSWLINIIGSNTELQ